MTAALLNLVFGLGLAGTGLSADGFERAIDTVLPRVVKLYGLGAGAQAGYGSGIVVSADGLVITTYSLLIDADRIRVVTAEGQTHLARVLATRPQQHLALLKIDAGDEPVAFPFFELDPTVQPEPGDWVLAAGNAFKVAQGSEPVSLTHGVFSARTRLDARRRLRDFSYRDDVLVIDAITSNPGAPGGAVVDLEGQLVGMIGRNVISNFTHTHFNYAIPVDVLHAFLAEARENKTPTSLVDAFRRRRQAQAEQKDKPDTGIRMAAVGYRQVLPFVERVVRDSPADRAGVRPDDLVMSVNGKNVSDVKAYRRQIDRAPTDRPLSLVLRRGDSIVAVEVPWSRQP